MTNVSTPIVPSLSTFVTNYRKSHTTIVTGRHARGVKVFTDYSERIPGFNAIQYAHDGFVPGRIVRSVSLERAPKNETEESSMDILQDPARIMSGTWIRTSDDSGFGLYITPSVTGAALGGRAVLLTAARSDFQDVALTQNSFIDACPVLRDEHIYDPGWYAVTLAMLPERCVSFM